MFRYVLNRVHYTTIILLPVYVIMRGSDTMSESITKSPINSDLLKLGSRYQYQHDDPSGHHTVSLC